MVLTELPGPRIPVILQEEYGPYYMFHIIRSILYGPYTFHPESRDASLNFRTLGIPYPLNPVLRKIGVAVLKFILQKYDTIGITYSLCQLLVKMTAQIRSPLVR